MKRFAAIAAVSLSLLVPSSPMAQGEYGFTLSASSTTPDVNETSFAPGVRNAYLWLKCCDLPSEYEQGISAAEFSVASTNLANVILGFTPVFPWLPCGEIPTLFLACAVDCPCNDSLVGNFLVLFNAPGSLCIVPSSTGTRAGVDCSNNPSLWPIEWVGLDFGGGFCGSGSLCGVISVEDASWGGVKTLYR
jgi:hypothetical protein